MLLANIHLIKIQEILWKNLFKEMREIEIIFRDYHGIESFFRQLKITKESRYNK